MIGRSILNPHDVLSGVLQHARAKGAVGLRVEPSLVTLIKEAPSAVINPAEDFKALTRARRLDPRLVAAPCPGVCEGPPLRERGLIATQQQGAFRFRHGEHLGPGGVAPLLALGIVQMIGDQGGFLVAIAELLEQLGDIEDVVIDPKALVEQRLNHWGTPARGGQTRLHWPLVQPFGQYMFLGFGPLGRPPGGLFPPQAFEASDQKPVHPLVHGLGGDTERRRDLRTALALCEGQSCAQAFDLVQLAKLLGGVQLTCECATRASRDRHTKGAHGDSPLRNSACPVVGGEYPDVGSHVKPSSDGINHFSVPQKIFFLRSISEDVRALLKCLLLIAGSPSEVKQNLSPLKTLLWSKQACMQILVGASTNFGEILASGELSKFKGSNEGSTALALKAHLARWIKRMDKNAALRFEENQVQRVDEWGNVFEMNRID